MKSALVCFLLVAMARSENEDRVGEMLVKPIKYPLIKGCLEISDFNRKNIEQINSGYKKSSGSDMSKQVGLRELIKFEERIGRGFFGSVYKINFGGKVVSVKAYFISSQEEYLQRSEQYAKEIQAIEKMQEKIDGKLPQITFEYYGCAQDDDYIFLVQEMLYRDLEDKDIKSMIRKAISKTRIEVYIKIAEKLALMHKKGYIHEDVKLSNIMVRSNKTRLDDLEFRFVDFGTASLINTKGMTGDLRFANPSKLPYDRKYPETLAVPFDDVFSLVMTIITFEGKAEDIYEANYDEDNTEYRKIVDPMEAKVKMLDTKIREAVDDDTKAKLISEKEAVEKTLETYTLMGYKCKDDTFDMTCRDHVYERSKKILEKAKGNLELLPILEDCIYNGEKGQFKNMDLLIEGLRNVYSQKKIIVIRPRQTNHVRINPTHKNSNSMTSSVNLGKSTINAASRPSTFNRPVQLEPIKNVPVLTDTTNVGERNIRDNISAVRHKQLEPINISPMKISKAGQKNAETNDNKNPKFRIKNSGQLSIVGLGQNRGFNIV